MRSPRLAIPLTRDCTPAPFAIYAVLQVIGQGACLCLACGLVDESCGPARALRDVWASRGQSPC